MTDHAPYGIRTIDTGHVRPGLAASHLLVRDGRAAYVDVGTNRGVPGLLAALDGAGVARDAVDHVILTHVHLDHAGGAGALMREMPAAVLAGHPRGLPFLVDPSRLEAATRAVYGDREYDRLFGPLVPVDASRVRPVAEGSELALGRSKLRFLETPGHALHHVAILDEDTGAVFAGDALGISYRVFDNAATEPFVFATTSPTQFDPAQSHASIDKLLTLAPGVAYLAHYGPVTGLDRLAADLHADIDRFVAIVEARAGEPGAAGLIARDMLDHLTRRLDAHGSHLDSATRDDWLGMDLRLNSDGLLAWRDRLARASKPTTPG